ncbi:MULTISPECIES: Rv3235 family protein [unclassified Streptomyces]|uniref:Rv3235 family protein n=1 Tax=unclassified Streptomyces TaxID=2593676 RepID=UPI00068901E3|nr:MULTISPECIES: Rv3235 family protein [unclassified Streptomyces]
MNTRGPRRSSRPPNRRDTRRPARVRPQAPPHPTELFTDRLLLVLAGHRPLHWFARHTTGHGFDDLLWLLEHRPLARTGPRPAVHGIGHFEAGPGAYEVFARISVGPRLHALAFRLALTDDHRWRCTAVELDARPPRDTY